MTVIPTVIEQDSLGERAFLLAHTREPNRLDRYLRGGGVAVVQKAGWIEQARHDGGLVYWPGGAFVAVVMTWNGRGTGISSDVSPVAWHARPSSASGDAADARQADRVATAPRKETTVPLLMWAH